MAAELNIDKFEDFIAQYPIFEYRILNTGDLSVEERVRIVCQQESFPVWQKFLIL